MEPSARADADEAFVSTFNDLLVSTFRTIEGYEQAMLDADGSGGLTIAEVHLVEAVGRAARACPAGATVGGVAEALGVRTPTVTAQVNRLAAKGLLAKARNTQDARIVNLSLTQAGEKAYRLHALFHRRLARAVLADLTERERDALVSGIGKLEAFFSAPLPTARTRAQRPDGAPQEQED